WVGVTMRWTARFAGVTSLLLAGPLAAHAADLKAILKAPPPPPPIYSWAGLYGGLNIGAVEDVGRLSTTLTLEAFSFTDTIGAFTGGLPTLIFVPSTVPVPVAPSRSSKVGILGGGQLGYNWQLARWIYGVEADLEGTSASESFAVALSQTFTGVA